MPITVGETEAINKPTPVDLNIFFIAVFECAPKIAVVVFPAITDPEAVMITAGTEKKIFGLRQYASDPNIITAQPIRIVWCAGLRWPCPKRISEINTRALAQPMLCQAATTRVSSKSRLINCIEKPRDPIKKELIAFKVTKRCTSLGGSA